MFSCNKKQEQTKLAEDAKPLLSVVKEYSSIKEINPVFYKEIENWKELNAVNDFLKRFQKVSANEVLSNALELEALVKNLKDSVTPELFNNASFHTRVNIFYNETLRLSDMTTIPAIQATEVHVQTNKVINAFSAVNAKVNTALSKKRFEDEIDIDITFIGLDSTKMDSVTRKTVNKNLPPKLPKNFKPVRLKREVPKMNRQ